ncbi:MAG: hypothetical protein U0787_15520 [Polyangia bacterium]
MFGLLGLWAGCAATDFAEVPTLQTANLAANPDGDLTATMLGQVVNRYAPLSAAVAAGDTAVSVTNLAALNVAPDDLLLIIELQGAQIRSTDDDQFGSVQSLQGAGLYELVKVRSVDLTNSRVLLDTRCGGLRNAYSATGKSQVVRVPQVGNLTIPSGTSIVAQPWDGQKGGIVALRASGNITIDGAVDVSGQGFRGGSGQTGLVVQTDESPDRAGYRTTQASLGAAKGESIAGFSADYAALGGAFGRGAPANGGGGGNGVKSGGGGGANGGAALAYDGSGVMDANAVGKAAWNLDPAAMLAGKLTTSAGGGRGGYSGSSSDQDALVVGPGTASWGGNQRRERGGRGGHPIVQAPGSRLFFGGGGGGGDASGKTAAAGAPGGSGGGLAFLWGSRLSGAGRISASGLPGGSTSGPSHDQAGGGGGGGGTLALFVPVLEGSLKLQAAGGLGGNQGAPAGTDAAGPGGGGGGGVLVLPGTLPVTVARSTAGAAAGTTLAAAVSEFPVNGATRGSDGEEIVFVPGSALYGCMPTDLSIAVTSTQKSAVPGLSYTISVTVQNLGSETVIAAPLSSLLSPLGIPSVNWSCSAVPATVGDVASCNPNRGFQDLNSTVTLSPGQKAVYQVVIAVPSALTGTLTYQATVAAASGQSDVDLSNNVASLSVPIQPVADLQALVTMAPQPAAPGQPISVLAQARNMGPSDARDIVLRFVIPDGFRVLREPSSATMTCSGSAETGYECTAAQLARFGTDDVLLVLEPVDSPSALTFADSVRGSVGDDTPGNNQATATVQYDSSLAPYRPAQLAGGGFGCGVTQAFPATKSSLLFGSAVLLFSTALRHVRRLRRGRLFRNR